MITHLSFSGITHQGLVRQENQDAIHLPSSEGQPRLFLVADGMGGANGGRTASEMAVARIPGYFVEGCASHDPGESLRLALKRTNAEIFAASLEDDQYQGMGTTLVGLAIHSDAYAVVANVGDSRCYLLQGNALRQITEDHSLVQEMRRSGQLSDDQAKSHEMRNVLSRALGVGENVVTDVFRLDHLQDNDLFLLCSDGLHGTVSHEGLLAILTQPLDISSKAQKLLQQANDHGGPDNISVILVKVRCMERRLQSEESALCQPSDGAIDSSGHRRRSKGLLARFFKK